MAFVTIPNTIRVHLPFQGAVYRGGSRIYLAYDAPQTPSSAQLVTLANSCADQWTAFMSSEMVSALTMGPVTCQDMALATGAVGVGSSTAVGSATVSNPLPAETAFLINFKINTHYRGGHPRIYLPLGSYQELQDATHWAPAFAQSVHDHFVSWIGAIRSGTSGITGLQHVAVSQFSGHQPASNPGTWDPVNVPKPRPGGPITYPVVSYVASVTPASQRQRMQR